MGPKVASRNEVRHLSAPVVNKDMSHLAPLAEQLHWTQTAKDTETEAARTRQLGDGRQTRRLERYAAKYRHKLEKSIERHGDLMTADRGDAEETALRILLANRV